MTIPQQYLVTPVTLPVSDRSGAVGERLLKLLSVQAERGLQWALEVSGQPAVPVVEFAVPEGKGMKWPVHNLFNAATNAYVFAALARFGTPGRTMGGISREQMEQMAVVMIRAVADTHPVSGSAEVRANWWDKWRAIRVDHIFQMGGWLLWDRMEPETRLLLPQILAHDADLYLQDEAPALLYDDTQAESNAWTGGGLALAYCMLKQHPHREMRGEKAREFMVSAYATAEDLSSERLVDGKPLNRWLHGANAFPDYTVENHGFIHPIYIAAVSEMVRSVICYRLAGERVPEAATFNAAHVFDTLMLLNLPDGNHLYVQGTDYDPRRLDSFLQACNIIPLKPDPLREACFLRVLGSMERMARERPEMDMSGDILFRFDFGTSWALTENYMMRRLFGGPAEAIPEDQIEQRLAGVHMNELARFALHRTPRTVSTFSWHAIERSSQVMGITMPLQKDVLCCAYPCGSYIGDVDVGADTPAPPIRVVSCNAVANGAGFGVVAELERCSGKVTQHCAFVSLPDGRSVYLEHREARQAVSVMSADSGNVWIYDDLRWPFQKRPRTFCSRDGILRPVSGRTYEGNWINVDDRMGYAAMGLEKFGLETSTDRYHTWRLAFVHPASGAVPQHFEPGQSISSFGLVSCPHQASGETEGMAEDMSRRGWHIKTAGVLALVIKPFLVYASFEERPEHCPLSDGRVHFRGRTAGWLPA